MMSTSSFAQQKVSVKWELSNDQNLSDAVITGNDEQIITSAYLSGSQIAKTSVMTGGNADTGYTAPAYDPYFTQFYVSTRQTAKTGGHNIAFGVTPSSGHSFKPTKISFDAAKCGTDGGNFDVYVKVGSSGEQAIATTQVPLRNKVSNGNPNGYSHHEYTLNDFIVKDGTFLLFLYIYNINGIDNENPKAIAFRNVVVEGVVDEPVYDVSHYISDATFTTAQGDVKSVYDVVKNLGNGQQASYSQLLYGDPDNFQVIPTEGYKCDVTYQDKIAVYNVKDANGEAVFVFSVIFKVTYRTPKPEAKTLNRGLISINLSASGSTGNLISWRYREADNNQVKFKLYKGNASKQSTALNGGNYIYEKTNFRDTSGNTANYYKLEVYDLEDNLIETEVSGKTWANQSMEITTSTPVDTRGLGATYTPNDATFCDMDGDGEYEIVVKWEPSNSKDAASNGVTSDTYIDCYKMDGTQLWRINIGPNLRAGAHTTPFLCWDFDSDGYGEMMCKTAPGTVDGEGNYVIMGDDDPTKSWLNSRGKPDDGPEYLTVFDGLTGAELATVSYHTKYGDVSTSFWGDNNQNRSERYLACVAYLDGVTPSGVFCRGYYSGAALGAYNWDGTELKLAKLHRSSTSGKDLWGEGAHFCIAGDVDNDGFDEIVYGAATLDHDFTKALSRTGFGHGDALHLGDFVWDNPGQEIFMVQEKSPYGYHMRDAATGKVLLHVTAEGDTGRGLAADFSAVDDGAELMASCTASLMDCYGNTIADSWAIGSSGAGINNRIYWKGDPYDDFFDKSVIGHWNTSGKYFDRIQVNGSNYTPGTLNNGTKYNPCVLGDMLGDWREEIVTYNSANNALIITTTNYESNYRIPHLMDNRQYAELIANQNVGYNQPPHLSYDPAKTYELQATIPESGWLPLYTSYSLQVPSDATIYAVSGLDTKTDTLKLTKISTTIPANYGFLVKGTPGTSVRLKTADANGTTTTNRLIGDAFLPVKLQSTETISYYKWDYREEIGLGYFKVDEDEVSPKEPYIKASLTSERNEPYYLIGATAVDIQDIAQDEKPEEFFMIDGRKVSDVSKPGIYISSEGRKIIISR